MLDTRRDRRRCPRPSPDPSLSLALRRLVREEELDVVPDAREPDDENDASLALLPRPSTPMVRSARRSLREAEAFESWRRSHSWGGGAHVIARIVRLLQVQQGWPHPRVACVYAPVSRTARTSRPGCWPAAARQLQRRPENHEPQPETVLSPAPCAAVMQGTRAQPQQR